MTNFEVVEARRHMCGKLARQLRHEHQSSALRLGLDVHRGLRDVYDRSAFYRRAWLIDGQLAALGGAVGSALSPSAFVWLAITDRATFYPRAIVKELRRQQEHLMQTKLQLVTTVIDGDEAALRLLVFMGWHVRDQGLGAAAETRSGRRTLMDFIAHEDTLRVPAGSGSAIQLGYHAMRESIAPALTG